MSFYFKILMIHSYWLRAFITSAYENVCMHVWVCVWACAQGENFNGLTIKQQPCPSRWICWPSPSTLPLFWVFTRFIWHHKKNSIKIFFLNKLKNLVLLKAYESGKGTDCLCLRDYPSSLTSHTITVEWGYSQARVRTTAPHPWLM